MVPGDTPLRSSATLYCAAKLTYTLKSTTEPRSDFGSTPGGYSQPRIRSGMTRLTLLLVLLAALAMGCDEPVEHPAPTPGKGQITVIDQIGPAGKTGWWPTLALDSKERPHLAWCDVWNGDLKYAARANDGSWTPLPLPAKGAVGKYTSLAVGPTTDPLSLITTKL